MFYFQLFGIDAAFDEKDNTLSYAGEKQSFSTEYNNVCTRTLYFKFNHMCNLTCSYCFQRCSDYPDAYNLSLDHYESLLNKVMKSDRFDRFVIFGGEPFIGINYDNVQKLLTRCEEKKICAFSNGTFDENFLELLHSHREKIEMITVTLDGDSKQHNRRRIYASGTGTFDIILNRLIKMQSRNIPFTIQINIDRENINHLDSLFKIIRKKLSGVSNIILNRVLHESNGISELELMKCFVNLKRRYSEFCIVPNSQCYKKLCSIITNNGIMTERCGIGGTYVFDFQNHSIYACPQSEETKCGTFSTDNFNIDHAKIEEYDNYSKKYNRICINCDMRSMCMYGCIVEKDSQITDCREKNRECVQYIFNHFAEIFELE